MDWTCYVVHLVNQALGVTKANIFFAGNEAVTLKLYFQL